MNTLSGEVTLLVYIVSVGSSLKLKEFAPPEQILSTKRRSLYGSGTLSKEANMKSQKLSPFVRIAEKHDVHPFILKL